MMVMFEGKKCFKSALKALEGRALHQTKMVVFSDDDSGILHECSLRPWFDHVQGNGIEWLLLLSLLLVALKSNRVIVKHIISG